VTAAPPSPAQGPRRLPGWCVLAVVVVLVAGLGATIWFTVR
jgi:hypothetical protein